MRFRDKIGYVLIFALLFGMTSLMIPFLREACQMEAAGNAGADQYRP